jgi:hypothetical protein
MENAGTAGKNFAGLEKNMAQSARTVSFADTPCAREMTAREVLESAMKDAHQQLEGLNKLFDCLPAKLPWEADRALARLINLALRSR